MKHAQDIGSCEVVHVHLLLSVSGESHAAVDSKDEIRVREAANAGLRADPEAAAWAMRSCGLGGRCLSIAYQVV